MSQAVASPVVKQATFLGHPVGLYVLFFTEMWERFSYYGMRALLMLYMVNYFRYSQQYASSIYKIYTSLVYVTPILGGYLADRYLGNKRAVIIGAVLMAIGHFLMAFDEYAIFMSALVFLILGNGFFKPNMSTQVGRLYPANDGRRDGAYTIFYMGINLGAFLSPIVCGWLRKNTVGEYHSGFTMAGIGMVIGLVIYLVGQPLVRELPTEPTPTKDDEKKANLLGEPAVTGPTGTGADGPVSRGATEEPVPAVVSVDALTEAQASRQPSVFGSAVALIPTVLAAVGGLLILGALGWGLYLLVPALRSGDKGKLWDTCLGLFDPFMLSLGGVCLLLIAFVSGQVRQGMRDRVMAILVLGVFVVFFWTAFEQAGNVLNVWADKNTDTNITKPMDPVKVETIDPNETKKDGEESGGARMQLAERFRNLFRLKPSDKPAQGWGEWLLSSLNPMSAEWFQSINACAIFVLAPLFAYLWIKLDKAGMQPSIPMKMAIGLFFMALAMAVMMGAAYRGDKATAVTLRGDKIPDALSVKDGVLGRTVDGKFKPFHAGLLTYDAAGKELTARGVLPDTEADVIIGATAPEDFVKAIEELKKKSKQINGEDIKSVELKLEHVPDGFEMKYSLVKSSVVKYDPEAHTLTAYKELQEKEEKGLKVAAGDPKFRDTIHDLYVQSNQFRVSAWWLFWSYILATLGELCLSPVGLSMVSKLAPAKFATMLMGVWMLTSAFGNFAAGELGEGWGTTAPVWFFLKTTLVAGVASLVLLALVRGVTRTMHGVK
jgi:POT family proton-dependent oligopeptide transporter